MNKSINLLKLCEDVALNWNSLDRFKKYLELVNNKYNLGGVKKELSIEGNDIKALQFGKVNIKGHEGEYLYLVLDYTKSNLEKSGFITHFGFNKDKNADIKQIKSGVFEFSNSGARLIKIPEDFVKFEHIMALILNIGKMTIRSGYELSKESSTKQFLNMDIDEKFMLTATTIRLVFQKNLNGLVMTGDPGIGKTYTILEIIKDLGLKEGEDYFYVQGSKMTLVKFYEIMYLNKSKILIFDDSDSVIRNPDGINMLKAALDSNPRREISYFSPRIDSLGIPEKFQFTGKCIFISNLPMDAIDSAIRSRSVVMDLHMTRDEKFKRINNLIYKLKPTLQLGGSPESNYSQRTEVIDFLKEFMDHYPDKPKNLDIRTANKLLELRYNIDDLSTFKKLAANQLGNS